jgi:hypothetical protein
MNTSFMKMLTLMLFSGKIHPWLFDLPLHFEEKGQMIGIDFLRNGECAGRFTSDKGLKILSENLSISHPVRMKGNDHIFHHHPEG